MRWRTSSTSFSTVRPTPNRVHLYLGDALTILPELLEKHSFDLVYIDANKRESHRLL